MRENKRMMTLISDGSSRDRSIHCATFSYVINPTKSLKLRGRIEPVVAQPAITASTKRSWTGVTYIEASHYLELRRTSKSLLVAPARRRPLADTIYRYKFCSRAEVYMKYITADVQRRREPKGIPSIQSHFLQERKSTTSC